MPRLPDDVRENVIGVFGAAGREWLSALPALVDGLMARWELRPAGPAYGGGTHSLVLPVTRAGGGGGAVLKVPVVDDENRTEADALRLYAGEGAVLLLAHDPAASGALLLERLEPGTPLIEHPDRELAIDVACAVVRRLRRPVPEGHPFRPVPDLVRSWSERVPAALSGCGGAVPTVVARAMLAAIEALGEPSGNGGGGELLVNRDAHLGNILAAAREPWLLIDPKPLAGEAAFDGGWLLTDLLRPEPTAAAARRLAARVGNGLGVDPERVRLWALARAAENVMWQAASGEDVAEDVGLAAALTSAG